MILGSNKNKLMFEFETTGKAGHGDTGLKCYHSGD
jgi:hypothetical protein